VRRGVAADGGVQQQLEGEPGATRALGRQGRHRGQVAAGAVAGHGDAARVDAERLRVLRDPLHGGNRVLDRGRERVLCRPENTCRCQREAAAQVTLPDLKNKRVAICHNRKHVLHDSNT